MTERFNPYKQFIGSHIPNALLSYPHISSTAKLCWARMAQYAGENGECFPKQETLALELGTNKTSIIRVLKELEDKGFIEKVKPSGSDRLLHLNNRYYFLKHPILCISGSETNCTSGSIDSDTSESIDSGTSIYKENHFKENHIKDISIYSDSSISKEKQPTYETYFDMLWQKYPAKDGKKSAYRFFKSSVKTEQDWQDINTALNNYLQSERVRNGYVKNGSTWFNNWRDWIDYRGEIKEETYQERQARELAETVRRLTQ